MCSHINSASISVVFQLFIIIKLFSFFYVNEVKEPDSGIIMLLIFVNLFYSNIVCRIVHWASWARTWSSPSMMTTKWHHMYPLLGHQRRRARHAYQWTLTFVWCFSFACFQCPCCWLLSSCKWIWEENIFLLGAGGGWGWGMVVCSHRHARSV